MKIKTYDYTELLKTMNEMEMEKNCLLELEKMNAKNRYIELEKKVLESGILEDFKGLYKVQRELWSSGLSYTRFKNKYLDKVYNSSLHFIEYDCNFIGSHVNVRRGTCSTITLGYYTLVLTRTDGDSLVWSLTDRNGKKYDCFENDVAKHYETKSLILKTLLETYDDYRAYVLERVNEKLNEKAKANLELAMRELPKVV